MICTHGDREEFYVFNPTTQKYTLIPWPPFDKFGFIYTFLDSDPKKSLYYKLVFTGPNLKSDNLRSYEIDTYSSEDKSWRQLKLIVNFGHMNPCAFWDGTVHWLGNANIHVQFNLDTEKLTETWLPRKVDRKSRFSFRKRAAICLWLRMV